MNSPVTTVRRPQVVVTMVRPAAGGSGTSDHADLTNLNLSDAAHVADGPGAWAFDALGDSLLVAGVDGQYLKFGAGGVPEAASPPGGVSDHDDLGKLGLADAKHTATGAGLWGFTKAGDSSLITGTVGQFARFGTDGVPEADTVTASDVGADAAGTAASLVGAEATTRANADTALQTAITAEETARIAADGVLTTSIGTVASNLATHEGLTKGAHGMTTFGAGFVAQADAPGGRGALSLGDSSTRNVGTSAGTVAAGDDSRITGAVQSTRSISTTAPLTGGGALASDRTLGITVGSSGGVQGWSANLDSYATVAPSAFTLTLLDDADQATWRSTLGLGSAATQTAQVAPVTSRVPLSRSGLARLRPGWAREVGAGTPTAGEDNTLGYEVGDTWTYQGRHYVAESVATGAANWIGGLIASDATASPTASKIPIADGSGKLATGWLPAATTSAVGAVELATDFEASVSVVPTGADSRLGWGLRSLLLSIG